MGLSGQRHHGSCGDCTACCEICPTGAISTDAYDVTRCRKIVSDSSGNYKTFYGLCVKICPIGKADNRVRQT